MNTPFHVEAAALLQKARDDAYAFERLAGDPNIRLWTLGFHAQQSVEKSIKAVLLKAGIRYPFTHDLETLLKVLRTAGVPLPPDSDNIPRLSPFATLLRYEDDVDGDENAQSIHPEWMKSTVAGCIQWAQTMIERESDQP